MIPTHPASISFLFYEFTAGLNDGRLGHRLCRGARGAPTDQKNGGAVAPPFEIFSDGLLHWSQGEVLDGKPFGVAVGFVGKRQGVFVI